MPLPRLEAEALDRVVADNDTVFISFWAPACPACRAYEPVLEAAARKHPEIAFFRVNTHEQKPLAASFEVANVPCLVVIRESVLVALQPGGLQPEILEDLIGKVAALDMGALKEQMRAALAAEEEKPDG